MAWKIQIKRLVPLMVALLWTFVSVFIINELMIGQILSISARAGILVSLFTYPFFGWLADTRYGRYKVIKYSLHILWITSVFYCLLSVVLELLSAYGVLEDLEGKQHAVYVSWYIVLGLGLGGLLANIIQFSIDQLQDRSSEEITSFLRWTGLAWFLTFPIGTLVRECIVFNSVIGNSLVIPAILTVSLCLDYVLSSTLVKEPVSSNSAVTIFRVLSYAMRNKYPRLRSTHPYWNNSFSARIDLAKTEYGGPFTANQVEDTKAFWRIIALMVFGTILGSFTVCLVEEEGKMKYYYKNGMGAGTKCDINLLEVALIEYVSIILISLVLLALYCLPCSHFKNYVNNIPILSRFSVGMFILILSISGYGILEVVGHFLNHRDHVEAFSCAYDLTSYQTGVAFLVDYKWSLIPKSLRYLSQYLLMTTGAEFLCAQSPYSMKGLLFGLSFGFMGIFSAINYSWMVPFRKALKHSTLSVRVGCGTIYFFSIVIILLVTSICFLCTYKFYKRRQRNDDEEYPQEIHTVDAYSEGLLTNEE